MHEEPPPIRKQGNGHPDSACRSADTLRKSESGAGGCDAGAGASVRFTVADRNRMTERAAPLPGSGGIPIHSVFIRDGFAPAACRRRQAMAALMPNGANLLLRTVSVPTRSVPACRRRLPTGRHKRIFCLPRCRHPQGTASLHSAPSPERMLSFSIRKIAASVAKSSGKVTQNRTGERTYASTEKVTGKIR